MTTVTKYILKEYLPTFFVAFLFFFIIFVINHILYYIKPLFEKAIPLDIIGMMFVTAFPLFTILSLPFGVMLATLMTMGRFSTDNEIVAFRSLGFNIMKIFRPIFITGALVSIFAIWIYDSVYPRSSIKQRETLRKISQIKPTIDFKSKMIKKYSEKTLFTDEVKDTSINGLIIIDGENQDRIITAKSAEITSPEDRSGTIELKMNNTMIQLENKDRPNEFNYGYSDNTYYYINYFNFNKSVIDDANFLRTYEIFQRVLRHHNQYTKEVDKKFQRQIRAKESARNIYSLSHKYTSSSIHNKMNELDNQLDSVINNNPKKQDKAMLNNYKVDLYNKFALPLACFIFAIFAAPIGIFSKRAGFSIGFILGVFLCAFYWFAYYGGQILGRKSIMMPFFAMFGPNLIFLIIGVICLIQRLRE